MIGRIAAIAMLAVAVLGTTATAQTTTPDASAIVTRAARVYKGLSGLQAEFRQRIEDPFLGPTDARGIMSQTGTTPLAMRFSEPANEAIVIDGQPVLGLPPEHDAGAGASYPMPSTADYGVNLIACCSNVRSSDIASVPQDRGHRRRRSDALLLEPIAAALRFVAPLSGFDREDGLPGASNSAKRTRQADRRTLPAASERLDRASGVSSSTVPNGVRVVDQRRTTGR